MSRPGLFARLGLVARYEKALTDIVTEAVQLIVGKDAAESEPSLNRKLYQSIIATYKERRMRGEYTPDCAPAFDAPNPPLSYEFIPSENKRPDLRWDLVDHLADPETVRSFAVECKRLRSKSDTGWQFNRSYALHGIARFVELDHQYGANMACGAMVGYWQNMSRSAILADVNSVLKSMGLPELNFDDGPPGILHQTDQMLTRSFAVSPFRLIHLWLDMRDSGSTSSQMAGAASQWHKPDADEIAQTANPDLRATDDAEADDSGTAV